MTEEPSPTPDVERPQVDAEHPWPGLPAFREADQAFFFGRNQEADELTERVELNRLTVLFGISGLGKSSLLQAGVFPRLRERKFLPVYLRLNFAKDAFNPSEQIARALERACRLVGGEAPRKAAEDSAWEYLHRKDVQFWSDRNHLLTPVLVFDQFEEALRRSDDPAARQLREEAVEGIGDLAEGRVPPALKARLERRPDVAEAFTFSAHRYRIVLSLREDYLADLEDLKPRMPSVAANRMRLSHLRGTAAAEAVFDAGQPGGVVDNVVAMGIVRFVGESETRRHAESLGDLPIEPALLSVICRELNNERIEKGAPAIRLQQLERDKGEILRKFYERAFDGIPSALRVFVEDRLVTGDGMRELVARQTVLRTPGVTEADLDALIDRRVLHPEERDGRRLVELTHDRLAPVVKASGDERRKLEEAKRAVEEREAEVERQRELLARAEREKAIAEERTQLVEELARVTEEQRRATAERLEASRRQTRIVAALLVVATFVAGIAIWQGIRAQRAQKGATAAQRLAEVRLAAASFREATVRVSNAKPDEALGFLARALRLDSGHSAARVLTLDMLMNGRWPSHMLSHSAAVAAVAWSPDGTQVATASEDMTARVWDAQTGQTVGPPLQHQDFVVAVAWSPDGTRVATASGSTARVWDARTGRAVGPPLQHDESVVAVAWSPDGTQVATGSWDNTARVWDAVTGQAMGKPMRHQEAVQAVAWSPDGRRVATGSWDATARVWNARTGEAVGMPLQHGGYVMVVAWSPDGTRVATGSRDKAARVWDARAGQVVAPLLQHQDFVEALAWSPDGTRLATGSVDRKARLWDARTGQLVGQPLYHLGVVWAVAWSPDSTRLATASADNTARVWDARTGQAVGPPLVHRGSVAAVAWSPDAMWLATGSQDDTARVWDARTGQAVGVPLVHQGAVTAVAWSPDGMLVATGSWDYTSRVWDVRTGQAVGLPMMDRDSVVAVVWSPDGKRLMGSGDRTARTWDARTGQAVGRPLLHQAFVLSVAWSPDGTRIATASADKTARVWDVRTGQAVGPPLRHKDSVRAVAWSKDGTRLVTGSDDETARVWDVRTGQAVGPPLEHKGWVKAVAWSPDGTRVVTGSDDKTARVWDARTGQAVGTPLQHQDSVDSVAWSPDGTRVVTGSDDKTARVWDARTGQAVGPPLEHKGWVKAVAWSPDGTRVATGSDDKTARVWDARTGQPVGASLQHQDSVDSVAWSPDGTRVVTGSADGTGRVFDAPLVRANDSLRLADVGELIGGLRVNDDDALAPADTWPAINARLAQLRRDLGSKQAQPGSLDQVMKWFFSDPRQRTISPLSAMSMDEYVSRMLMMLRDEGGSEVENEYPGHPMLGPQPTRTGPASQAGQSR